jgi:hypothetical protein
MKRQNGWPILNIGPLSETVLIAPQLAENGDKIGV